MDRAEFLAARRRGIGGSDVAPILGLSKWRTPLDVWRSKVEPVNDSEQSEPMYWGTVLESIILDEYERRTGRELLRGCNTVAHKEHPFLIANLDGMTTCFRVVDAKTARTADGWGEPGSDEVPDDYALQMQHYMFVTGAKVADLAVLIGGSDFRIYTVEADAEIQAMICKASIDFWRLVETKTPPEPVSYEDACKRFGRDVSGEVEADEKAYAAIEELRHVREQMKLLEAREDAAKAEIARALGERGDTLTVAGKPVATWKLAKGRKSFDTKRFEAEHPDLFSQYMRVGEPSRRLLIK